MFEKGDRVIYIPNEETATVVKVDPIYNQAEVKFDSDGVMVVIEFEKLKPLDYEDKRIKIALTGKMRSGKDALTEYAIKRYNFSRFAFGDELKKYADLIFGESETKDRSKYQHFGQYCRLIDNDVWVKRCFDKVNKFKKSSTGNIIISDLRQPNELQRCKDEGFIIVKVDCDDDIRLKRILEKNDKFDMDDLYHETEMYIDDFDYDYLVKNNKTLEDLYVLFDRVMFYEQNI